MGEGIHAEIVEKNRTLLRVVGETKHGPLLLAEIKLYEGKLLMEGVQSGGSSFERSTICLQREDDPKTLALALKKAFLFRRAKEERDYLKLDAFPLPPVGQRLSGLRELPKDDPAYDPTILLFAGLYGHATLFYEGQMGHSLFVKDPSEETLGGLISQGKKGKPCPPCIIPPKEARRSFRST